MIEKFTNVYRQRVDFGKIKNILSPPPLLEVQTESYEDFIQRNKKDNERKNMGLEKLLKSYFPIEDTNNRCRIEYISYRADNFKYDLDECRSRGVTHAMPIYVKLRLVIFDFIPRVSDISDRGKIKEIKEQEIYFGDFPLMNDTGYFVINGTERVVVNQLHRSAGVFFSDTKDKISFSGKINCSASIIPKRGPWIDFEFDSKDLLHMRVNRKKKILATTFLKALGYDTKQIIKKFYITTKVILPTKKGEDVFYKEFISKVYINKRIDGDLIDLKTKKIVLEKGEIVTDEVIQKINLLHNIYITVSKDNILRVPITDTVFDNEGKVILKISQTLTEDALDTILENKIKQIEIIEINNDNIDNALINTLEYDKYETEEEAITEIYKKLKNSSVVVLDKAKIFINSLLFNDENYDLSFIGRMQFNKKFNLNNSLDDTVLKHEDLFMVIEYLFKLRKRKVVADDIDHLKNRRVKVVGELLSQCFNKGLFRVVKTIKEKMLLLENENISLQELINVQPIISSVHEFFAVSQLSQFMDQTNPLSEITHKRRLSALGPGGLSRERAGFEVRDVHPSHYGRICPIETPEGASIGLMSSLTIYAKLDAFGFIETPYREVKSRKLTNKVSYMSPLDDDNFYIAQSNALLDKNEVFIKEIIALRKNSEFKSQPSDWAQYIDLSPKQLISVAASLIPFLEHDDANRALMGSNMQRQSVPLVISEAPFVGTGMEYVVAKDSGVCVIAEKDGIVDSVDSTQIVIKNEHSYDDFFNVKIYKLKKYQRSNQNTCINQKALIKAGDKVKKGQIIADGQCCESGELALGKNVLVAFMSWNGYNYEDSIIVSERLLHKDIFTSVHIEKFDVSAMDTKIGRENITRDIPNSSEYNLRHLDDSGIVRIGNYVKTGDILVGKTTPKSESKLGPEEKLLRAIFGDRAGDIRDTSLRVPQGINGIVIDVKVFYRRGVVKDSRTLEIEEKLVNDIDEDYKNEVRILKSNFIKNNIKIFTSEAINSDILNAKNHELLFKKGYIFTEYDLMSLPVSSFFEIRFKNADQTKKVRKIIENLKNQFEVIRAIYREKIERKRKLEDLPQGINRIVKVYIAMKRKLSVGDKMAGRHGNKGVISKILPIEEMPYTEDGEPIDLILNPLGVPSRMNVGQILETHLGLVSKKLSNKITEMMDLMLPYEKIKDFVKQIYQSDYINKYLDEVDNDELLKFFNKLKNAVHFASPVFDGAKEEEIHRLMDFCGIDRTGKVTLYDGRTGDKFSQKITIGYKYMCKLYHLVDDKLHARSTGPYSLVTQQPLGGKSHFGGQRFGEMEVWSLEAYGAAYTLKELLTVKSDDIHGRNKIYESLVKGDFYYNSGIPESFKVLINEVRSLCIDLKLIGADFLTKNSVSEEA